MGVKNVNFVIFNMILFRREIVLELKESFLMFLCDGDKKGLRSLYEYFLLVEFFGDDMKFRILWIDRLIRVKELKLFGMCFLRCGKELIR